MASEQPSDVLPILGDRGFDQSIRGYDRTQVDRYLGRIEDELRAAANDRDESAARSADLAAQLASAHAQIESLRRQLRAATETVTAENVEDYVKQMLETAKAEAKRIRHQAEDEAEQVRNGAADQAARTRAGALNEAERIVAEATALQAEADETFRRRIADAESHRATVEAGLAANLAQTRAEEDRLTAEAAAERDQFLVRAAAVQEQLDAEAAAKRAEADEDFEITLRARRTAEAKAIDDERAAAHAAAQEIIEAARRQAGELVAEAVDEVRRLRTEREAALARLNELQSSLAATLRLAAEVAPVDGA